MDRLRVIFAGSGEFGIPSLRALAQRHDLLCIYTQPDRPAGRGRHLRPTPVGELATAQGWPLVKTANINAEVLPPADLLVVIAFGQKISAVATEAPHLGAVNLHASLLPRYRGAAPIHWAILRGETETGNSVIRLAQRMDAGAILGQSRLPIGPTETTGELHDRLAADGADWLARVLEELAAGRAIERAQDESSATLAPKLRREDALIDWNEPADAIARRIRGLSPWPGCRVALADAAGTIKARLTLLRAATGEGEGPRWHAGEIMASGLVAAGDGRGVRILDVQPENGRPMSLTDYRNGHVWQPGLRLVGEGSNPR